MHPVHCTKVAVFVCGALLSLRVYAQKPRLLEDRDKKNISFGLGLGPSYHKLSIDRTLYFISQGEILGIEPVAIPGFSTQSYTYIRIKKHWQLRTIAFVPFFNFSQYTFDIRERAPERIAERRRVLEAFKLGIPLDIMLRSDRINNFRFYALAGVFGHYNFFTTQDQTIRQDDIIVNLRSYDFGLSAGIGFDFYSTFNMISLEVKYGLGLNNLHTRDNASAVAKSIDQLFSRDLYFYLIIH